MIRFKRNPKIHERYNLLTAPALNLDEDEKKQGGGEEFATFLRSLSSTKQSSQSTGSGGVARTKFSNVGSKSFDNEKSKSDLPGYQPRQGGGVAAIMQLKSKNQEIHDKQLKVIEDHMWQHKQEERELKRIEGDIVKKQRQLRKTMQDYESAVYKKQREEEIQALKAKGDLEKIKQDAAAQENRLTREKIDKNISSIQRSKERDRKGQTSISSQELQYERIAEEINRRRLEVESMTKEFENKMKLKEEEVYKLRKELGEMAISINMESQKQRTLKYDEEKAKTVSSKQNLLEKRKRNEDYTEKMNGTTAKALQAERKQQELDKHLDTTLNHISLKIREEGRKLTDVKSRLQKNSQLQRDAQSDALHAAYNRQALDSDEKIKLVDARKAALQNSLTRDRKQRGAQILDEWRNRYLERTNEVKMKEVEDSVKHLSKFVAKQEDIEQSLYNQVKSSESERRKQEQTVEGIRQELSAVKKENARLIKETSIRCHKREEELVQKLLREEAALKKALSEREEKIRSFVKQRGFYQEEKDMLAKEQKIHQRLNRIGQKSEYIDQEMYA
ncbi:calponin homology domain-containing protein DDB_G0272472-like [Rhopilema esculentum]|uniref:calponin homology domain-containing protein DDB_G0272472-like n=1 Tax=Rhopilema esculentum TaxID=499914 RepID=UPI0031D48777